MHLAAYRRALRARNRSRLTIANYEETIGQLADHHGGDDVLELARSHIEDYIGEVLEQHASSTAAARFRVLRAFYNWAVKEELIEVSPMRGMSEPSVTQVPVAVVPDDDLRALLRACAGKDFEARRDTCVIRLFCEPGSPRVAEMAGILVDDLDMRRDQVRVHGKGDKDRDIPFGPKTGQALDRYLAMRRRHRLATRPELWLGTRGQPLTASGIQQMLHRRSEQAGLKPIHPHQLRHTAAHVWHDQGGSEADAMALFGWSSPDMPRRYGASARVDRAQRAARRATMADRL